MHPTARDQAGRGEDAQTWERLEAARAKKATAQREEAVPGDEGARQSEEAEESDRPGSTTPCAGTTGITWLGLFWFAGWRQGPRPQEEPDDASCLSFTAALPPIGQRARPREPQPTGSRH